MTKTKQEKRRQKGRDRLIDNNFTKVFITLLIFSLLYYVFIQPKTIGYDIKYILLINVLPTIVGIIFLGFFRRQYLMAALFENKGEFGLKTFLICFYLVQGLVFSYVSFRQLTKMGWDFANHRLSEQNELQIIKCNVTDFQSGLRLHAFVFEFQDRLETFSVSYHKIKEYNEKAPWEYEIVIKAREGLWNYYVVKSLSVVKK